jgi:hypothetical protein
MLSTDRFAGTPYYPTDPYARAYYPTFDALRAEGASIAEAADAAGLDGARAALGKSAATFTTNGIAQAMGMTDAAATDFLTAVHNRIHGEDLPGLRTTDITRTDRYMDVPQFTVAAHALGGLRYVAHRYTVQDNDGYPELVKRTH